jgi:hypothetical protein
VLSGAGIKHTDGQLVITRKNECAMGNLQVGGFDVFVQFAQRHGGVGLISRSIVARYLVKDHQFAVAAAALQATPVHFDFYLRHQPLVKCELDPRGRYGPPEGSLAALAQPLIEGDFLERWIKRSALSRSLGQEDGAERDK